MIEQDDAQIHVLEMLTLFWLFFASATFLLRIDVPDPTSVASEGSLELSARDAIDSSLIMDSDGNNIIDELFENNTIKACQRLLNQLPVQHNGRCWMALNHGALDLVLSEGTPEGNSISAFRLIVVGESSWTIALQVWPISGGIS